MWTLRQAALLPSTGDAKDQQTTHKGTNKQAHSPASPVPGLVELNKALTKENPDEKGRGPTFETSNPAGAYEATQCIMQP